MEDDSFLVKLDESLRSQMNAAMPRRNIKTRTRATVDEQLLDTLIRLVCTTTKAKEINTRLCILPSCG